MPSVKKNGSSKNATVATAGYEAELWQMANALRGSMDAADHKHVVLGPIFLKYISDAFEAQHAQLEAEEAQGVTRRTRKSAAPSTSSGCHRWRAGRSLKTQARQPTIGQLGDDAIFGIERDNPALKGPLSRDYARPALGKSRLRWLIGLIRNTGVGDASPQVLQTDAVVEVSEMRR